MTEIIYTDKFGYFDKLKIGTLDVQPDSIAQTLIRKGYARLATEPKKGDVVEIAQEVEQPKKRGNPAWGKK